MRLLFQPSGGSLHGHVLCWFKRRIPSPRWEPLKPLERVVPGTEPKQRPPTAARIKPQENIQEDSVYQLAEVARVSAEMPRADVNANAGGVWGGWDAETLRIAGLARSILIRLHYCHVCAP